MSKEYDDYFDEEDREVRHRNKGDNMAFMRSSNLLQSNTSNGRRQQQQNRYEEEDELDAYMKEINC